MKFTPGPFTPKRTLLGMLIAAIVAVTFAYDHSSRKRIEDILLSSIYSSNVLVQSNNYQLLAINLHTLKKLNPFIVALGIYVSGERRTGSGDVPKEIILTDKLPADSVQVTMKGFFSYEAYYIFSNTQNLLYARFAEPNRIIFLALLYLGTILVFTLIYWLSSLLDLDRIQEQALNYAFSLSGRTLHGLKTHMIHANQIYSILNQGTFPLNEEQKLTLQDFNLSKVEMDGHMSIMRLENFKKCREQIDLENNIRHLVQIYQRPSIECEIKCNHQSKLPIDGDIFTATVGNLIKNAFDYSDRRVWITTEESIKNINIIICNTGKEIPKEKLKRFWKLGFMESSGTGLGLHICRSWLNKLGGSLVLDSHVGATVAEVRFPLSHSSSSEMSSDPVRNKSSTSSRPHAFESEDPITLPKDNEMLKVAVVDDIASFRANLAKTLGNLNVTCETFDSLEGFLDTLQKNPLSFHAVIVDRHLRGENAVRDRFPDSCRYFGFRGSIILFSCDPTDSSNPIASYGFDMLLQKDEVIDWALVLEKIKKQSSF